MPDFRIDDLALEGVAFIGRTLGPLFCHDPLREREVIGASYAAVAGLDSRAAAAQWPFVDEETAFGCLCQMQEGLEDALDEETLAWEFRGLFVGPAAKAAPPWGSVYTDKDGVMFGASWVALREWLREQGVEAHAASGNEPEDHIGILLQLMAWLAEERPELLLDFLRLHLLPWSGHFLQLMQRATDHPFFEGLARLTDASLSGIQDALQLEVEIPRFYR